MNKIPMSLGFFVDSEIDAGSAKVIHALQMSDAYARYVEHVSLFICFNHRTREDVTEYVSHELGRKPAFQLRHLPLPSFRGRFKMVSGLLGLMKLRSVVEHMDCCVPMSPLLMWHLIKLGIPVIYEQHNSYLHKNSLIDRWVTKKVLQSARSELLRVFVTVSKPLSEVWMEKGVPASRILVQHDAVDESWLTFGGYGRSQVRRSLGLKDEDKMVLYTGSISPNRGTDRILSLAHEFPRANFVVIGWPRERATYLRDEAERTCLRNVTIMDRISHSEVISWLAAADVLLMLWSKEVPTINYCSPMKVFEYMAARKVIVGDGFPTIHEVLEHEKQALLSDPDSFQDLRRQLGRALSMTYPNAMADAAHSLVRQKYLWSVRAATILKQAGYLT